jgi:hypothetical protein
VSRPDALRHDPVVDYLGYQGQSDFLTAIRDTMRLDEIVGGSP